LKWVTLPSGIRLPYASQGDPGGVPVVLLHAYADSWRSYEPVLAHLPGSVRAFALTQRGHGDADRPGTGYAPEDFAADVAAFMDAVGLERAALVGDSGATLTAQRFALDHPARTLGLVLIGAPRSLRADPRFAAFIVRVAALRDPVPPAFVRDLISRVVIGPVPRDHLEAMVADGLAVPARVWQAVGRGLLEAVPPIETGTITAPALLLWGALDELCTRQDQDALLAAMPGARLVVLEDAGHLVHWEQPRRVAAEIAAFVARLPER
jgi:pimeloyl-ACP methyl ester carboxylesterase